VSRQELVSAFLEGRISRRTLIRRLIAGGISTGAAVSYAQLLRPEHALAAPSLAGPNDHYPMVFITIDTASIADAKANSRIAVTVNCTEELKATFFRVFLNTAGGGVPIGQRSIASFLTAAGTRQVAIPIDRSQLTGRTSAMIYVQLQGRDDESFPALASTRRRLS
jgi:hypothetical protein